MATSRDADEIIEKLSSDRARTRDVSTLPSLPPFLD